jgi:uncharacterized DUF497 family protein
MVRITYDPAKRAATLRDRDIDFESAGEVFDGVVTDIRDERHLRGRMVIVVWTARGDARHVISMRKANDREQARFANRFREV